MSFKKVFAFILAMPLILLVMYSLANSQALDQGYIAYYNPLLNGATCDNSTLQAAVNAIGTSQRTLYLTDLDRNKQACVWNIIGSVTIPTNIRFLVPFGVTATIATGVTLTVQGCLAADDPNWFTGPGIVDEQGVCVDDPSLFPGIYLYGSVTSGCLHGTATGTTATIPSCDAFVSTLPGGVAKLEFVQSQSPTQVTYTGGNGQFWLIVRRDTAVTPTGWTCEGSTIYCFQLSPTKPTIPTGNLLVQESTISGGNITVVLDQRTRSITTLISEPVSLTSGEYSVWNFQPGGQLCPVPLVTLTHSGSVTGATDGQLFCVGAGNVRLQGKAAQRVLPQWFGADGTDALSDSTALTAWAGSVQTNGGRLFVPPGTYRYSTGLAIYKDTHIECANTAASVFQNDGTVQNFMFLAVVTDSHDITIRNCGFDGNGYNVLDFMAFVSFNTGTVQTEMRVEGNHMFDSNYVGDALVKQRQYILLTFCHDCWVQNNHLEQGGRIKIGRPGRRVHVNGNIISSINDNGITFADIGAGDFITEDIEIISNIIINPQAAGIFIGADGEATPDPVILRRVIVANNIVRGEFNSGGIQLTAPRTVQDILIQDNLVVLEDTPTVIGAPTAGIQVSVQTGSIDPGENIRVVGNTVVNRHPTASFSNAGIFFSRACTRCEVSRNISTTMRIQSAQTGLKVTDNILAGQLRFSDPAEISSCTNCEISRNNIVMPTGSTTTALAFQHAMVSTGVISDNLIRRDADAPYISVSGGVAHNLDIFQNILTGFAATTPIQIVSGTTITGVRVNNGGDSAPNARFSRHFKNAVTFDPPNLVADGDATATTVGVTGVAPLDTTCAAVHDQVGAVNVLINAFSSSANNVRVIFFNKTGGAVDILSGNLTVSCWKY